MDWKLFRETALVIAAVVVWSIGLALWMNGY